MALGPLRLRPEEYGRKTLAELVDMIDGWIWRDELEWERTAWATAHVINISGKSVKRDVTVRKLLGRGITPGTATQGQKDRLWESIKSSKLPDDDPRAHLYRRNGDDEEGGE